MIDIDQRLAMLIGRTTHEAWLELQRVRHHPNFEDLLTDLERLSGTVTDRDVGNAVRRIDRGD